ncbi:MAG: hypothetical protein ABI865_14990, partial [Nitrosospira sp.]
MSSFWNIAFLFCNGFFICSSRDYFCAATRIWNRCFSTAPYLSMAVRLMNFIHRSATAAQINPDNPLEQ